MPRWPYHRRFPNGMLLELAGGPSARGVVACGLVSAIPTSSAASSTTESAIATAAATTAKSGHLSQTGINLLLGLLQDVDEITGLLLVCRGSADVQGKQGRRTHCQW